MIKHTFFTRYYLLLFSIAVLTACSSSTMVKEDNNNPIPIEKTKADKINELVSTYVEYGKFNGTVLVAEKGAVIYKKGFGMANMEWEIPNQTDTKFRIASITKQFTAMLIMQLVAENKLNLDEPITTYLSDYPKETWDSINIHHLLTHTSGIPNFTSFPNYQEIMGNYVEPGDIVNSFIDSTLLFKPGERFNYSNSAYFLLGIIIEKTRGISYGEALNAHILEPIGMVNSGYVVNRKILKKRAIGYYNNAGSYVNSNHIDMSVGYAAGGIYATAEDMYLWDQALYTEKLLPKKYMAMILDKHIPAWGQHYGYGWNIGKMRLGNSEEFVNTIDHDGFVNGFNSQILRIPSDHSSVILLNNTGGAPLYEMNKAICGILYGKPYDLPKKSTAHAILDVIKKEGITDGLMFFTKVNGDNNYYLDEREMNLVGYELANANLTKEGLAVFKLNTESYPKSANAYDSYGEALMNNGNKEAAINNYKKSLKFNPKNENGIEMLKRMGVNINREDLYLLQTDPSWTKEIFPFPVHFATDLSYEGIEEAHFPKGWRKLESPEFWSYAFVWNINYPEEFTILDLQTDIQKYFDGLMGLVNKKKDFVVPKAIATLELKEGINDVPRFAGNIKMHDSFVTEKHMILNVSVEKHYCPQKKKPLLLFRFSPKNFEHDIWNTLNDIKLRDNKCEDL